MTEQLKTLMDRAADLDFAAVDLDAITGAGDRTVRRRRIATGVAGVAALAVVATGAVLLAGDGNDNADFVDTPFRTDVPMWTEGSVLHTPSDTYELGVDVLSMTRSASGIAFVGEGGGVYVFSGKDPERVGSSGDYPYLVSDAQGSTVGWVGESDGEPAFFVRDLASGTTTHYPAEAPEDGPDASFGVVFVAIDDEAAYWYDARGGTVVDLATGEERSMSSVGSHRFVIDAEAGRTVVFVESPSGADAGSDVVGADGQVLLDHRDVGTVALLSPDGRWATSAEGLAVWDVDKGREHAFASLEGRDGAGVDWLDDDTVMVVAELEEDHDRFGILTCEVPSGTCVEVAEPDIVDGQPFALPASGLLFGLGVGGGEASGSDSATSVEVEVSEGEPYPAESSSTERPE